MTLLFLSPLFYFLSFCMILFYFSFYFRAILISFWQFSELPCSSVLTELHYWGFKLEIIMVHYEGFPMLTQYSYTLLLFNIPLYYPLMRIWLIFNICSRISWAKSYCVNHKKSCLFPFTIIIACLCYNTNMYTYKDLS